MGKKFYNQITGQHVEAQPWQEELKPGDYYINKAPDAGIVDALTGKVLGVFDTEGVTVYCHIEKRARHDGFFWVTSFSQYVPEGEKCINCILDATQKITKEEFDAAVMKFQEGQ